MSNDGQSIILAVSEAAMVVGWEQYRAVSSIKPWLDCLIQEKLNARWHLLNHRAAFVFLLAARWGHWHNPEVSFGKLMWVRIKHRRFRWYGAHLPHLIFLLQ